MPLRTHSRFQELSCPPVKMMVLMKTNSVMVQLDIVGVSIKMEKKSREQEKALDRENQTVEVIKVLVIC